MKIIFVHDPPDLYGASRSLLRLSSRLVKDGHEINVLLPYEGLLKQELIKNGIEVLIHSDLPVITREKVKTLSGLISLLFQIPISTYKLSKIIKKIKPDIIHTNVALILSPCLIARLYNIPHIWHIREFFKEFKIFWTIYQWFIYYFSDIIICVSTPVGKQFKKIIFEKKVKIIHNGFPRNEFEPVSEERVQTFKKQFCIDNKLLIGVVGRIKFGRKGQDVFVKAVALLKDKFPEVRYVLIGSPFPGNEEHLDNLIGLIKELNIQDKIIYTGDVEDIKAAYSALDIVVLPSALPEPFGGVVIEAMALGNPVIGTNIGGTVEQVEHGVTGLLVNPDDPVDLSHAMEKLIMDEKLRLGMGENGRERFLKLFEFENFYKKILSLYEELILRSKRDV
jgi:glycosyltransferase involved in cell wall biosynthesis